MCALIRRLKGFPSEHRLLLTGTPLENRVGELATLVGYLRPDLARMLDDFSGDYRRRSCHLNYIAVVHQHRSAVVVLDLERSTCAQVGPPVRSAQHVALPREGLARRRQHR